MLAEFIGVDADENGFWPVTIGYNVQTEEEVLQLHAQLEKKVKILKPPQYLLLVGCSSIFQILKETLLRLPVIRSSPLIKKIMLLTINQLVTCKLLKRLTRKETTNRFLR